MFKRQKNMEIKIINFGATLNAVGYFKFLWDLPFGVWDFPAPSFDPRRTTRPAAL
jgi:hypothetical protein